MATLTAAPAVGAATAVTGSSYATNAKVTLISAFTATDGKRNELAMYTVKTDGSGALTASIPVRYTSGTMVIKSVDSVGAVLATASNLSV